MVEDGGPLIVFYYPSMINQYITILAFFLPNPAHNYSHFLGSKKESRGNTIKNGFIGNKGRGYIVGNSGCYLLYFGVDGTGEPEEKNKKNT